jgi:exopolysaccharide biosynthesis polyprenyl glycosylphosphotransferase
MQGMPMIPPRFTAVVLLGLDLIVTVLVFNAVSYFRGLTLGDHFIVAPLVASIVTIMIAVYLVDGYQARTDMLSVDYTSQHSIALVGAMLATLLLTYAFKLEDFTFQTSRFVIAVSFFALIPVTLGYRRMFYLAATASRGARSLIFLGNAQSCEAFRDECRKMGVQHPIVLSVVADETAEPNGNPGEIPLRPFRDVLDDVQAQRLAVEAFVLRESAHELVPEISRRLVQLYFAGIPTYTLELFHQVYWRKIPLYRLNQTWLFQEGFQIAREPTFERLKRVSDIVLSLVGLVLASPLIALGALAVWLDDRGPVFFFQRRVGRNHASFPLVKLRTMRVDPVDGDLYTRKDDPRITRVGGFLRTSRLDELPQLWNVLCGHMSLIGPRAEWDRLVEKYEREIPCYHFRHLVKPGITGWAQVNYPYGASIEDTVRKLEYDLYYIRHFSFRLDATITLKTIHTMLFGKGR